MTVVTPKLGQMFKTWSTESKTIVLYSADVTVPLVTPVSTVNLEITSLCWQAEAAKGVGHGVRLEPWTLRPASVFVIPKLTVDLPIT